MHIAITKMLKPLLTKLQMLKLQFMSHFSFSFYGVLNDIGNTNSSQQPELWK
uniref:Uncharacterized protein n=1 Tax=Rhizophora mucronata TaxID=61149 RepID=A0A2P2QA16_RHIMU